MTDAEIVKKANELAHMFFNALGYEIPKSYKIYNASHPRAKVCWNLTRIAQHNRKGGNDGNRH